MPQTTAPQYPRVAARISEKTRARLNRTIATANQGESAIVRAAVEEFLLKYTTTDKVITAVRESVRRAE